MSNFVGKRPNPLAYAIQKIYQKLCGHGKTTADGAFNLIATGKPEMPVGGQKRMLAEKKRNSKAY